MILKQFDKDLSFHKLPVVKYGAAVHRLGAREAPGEVERQLRKTLFRKSTRNQADMLCKFMLFKKGKFMPGKMV
jgi:hypothetical protein